MYTLIKFKTLRVNILKTRTENITITRIHYHAYMRKQGRFERLLLSSTLYKSTIKKILLSGTISCYEHAI